MNSGNGNTYSMNSNPGEDQWGQFNLGSQPEGDNNGVAENKESLKEKSAERGVKTAEAAINELNARLDSLLKTYEENKGKDQEAANAAAREYQKVFQQLTNIKEGTGDNPDEKVAQAETKMKELEKTYQENKGKDQEAANAAAEQYQQVYQESVLNKEGVGDKPKEITPEKVAEKGRSNKGFVNYRTLVVVMAGMAIANFLTGCANNAGIGNNSNNMVPIDPNEKAPVNIEGNLRDRGFPSTVEGFEQYAGTIYEHKEEAKEEFEAYTGYEILDKRLSGREFNGENLTGCHHDLINKQIVMDKTGRTIDNDFMTPDPLIGH